MTPAIRVLFATASLFCVVSSVSAGQPMPVAQQNALVQKYCAVCHTDVSRNGGLSLQHFDAATAPPSLKAMMLSKMTGGSLMRTARNAHSEADAAAVVGRTMKTGAMGAAGIPIPDMATIYDLIDAFAIGSTGAGKWNIERSGGVTASIVREIPTTTGTGEAEVYRFIATCNPKTHSGSLQLAWAPVPKQGNLSVSVDGGAAKQYAVEGSEGMGNGSGVILHGQAALALTDLPLPAESLTVSDLFPDQKVLFPFADLPSDARKELNECLANQTRSARAHQTR